MNETLKIKNYLAYIPQRLAWLKIFNVSQSNNEYKYYLELYESIKQYGKNHKIFFYYITSKIKIDKYKEFYKVSERTAYRILAKHCNEFINFLSNKETELEKKYPFENSICYKEV